MFNKWQWLPSVTRSVPLGSKFESLQSLMGLLYHSKLYTEDLTEKYFMPELHRYVFHCLRNEISIALTGGKATTEI